MQLYFSSKSAWIVLLEKKANMLYTENKMLMQIHFNEPIILQTSK